jgi:hypothetical protein
MSNVLRIPRQSDKHLVDVFTHVAPIISSGSFVVSMLPFVSVKVPVGGDVPPPLDQVLKKRLTVIQSISVSNGGFSISFQRGGSDNSAIFDSLSFNDNGQGPVPPEKRTEAAVYLADKLRAFDPDRGVSSKEEAQLTALHASMLDKLELLASDLIVKYDDKRTALERSFDEKGQRLEEQIDEERARIKGEHDKRDESLVERETKLAQRLAELDDRDNTHARRQIRKDLLGVIQERTSSFLLTSGTNRKRGPIHVAFLGTLAVLAWLTFSFASSSIDAISKSNESATVLAALFLRSAVVTGGFLATVFFYIRWMNRWFEQHADAEFGLKRFQLDVERASWVVETALEWKSADAGPIPRQLLDGITRSLFEHHAEKREDLQSPADQLASALIGSASNIKLSAADGNAEIDIGRRGLNKLKKDVVA